MKATVIIDGIRVESERGTAIIHAATRAGVVIPTLCFHERLKPHGSCRLCIVEVRQQGRRRLVTACSAPIETGMEVSTDTPEVRHIRRMIVTLLLARCPEEPVLQAMARSLGVEPSGFPTRDAGGCILCGLCVRVCEEVVGACAIGLSNRGIEREVSTPFGEPTDVCIGCGSCTYICPTGCLEMTPVEKNGRLRRMVKGRQTLPACENQVRCEGCKTDEAFLSLARSALAKFRASHAPSPDLCGTE